MYLGSYFTANWLNCHPIIFHHSSYCLILAQCTMIMMISILNSARSLSCHHQKTSISSIFSYSQLNYSYSSHLGRKSILSNCRIFLHRLNPLGKQRHLLQGEDQTGLVLRRKKIFLGLMITQQILSSNVNYLTICQDT